MGKLTHTVKGPIASFRSADKADIESLKLHFLPKQEGSGDPSPTNIRPITGWTGCNLFKAKKNLIDVSDSNIIYSVLEQTNGTFINTNTDTRDDVQIYLEGYKIKNGNYTLLTQFRVSSGITSTRHIALSFTVPSSCEDITHFCIKHNGRARDFRVYFPVKLPVGASLCCSFDITGVDVKTIGGFSFNNVQLQVGDESALESYEGGKIPITFPIAGTNKLNPSDIRIYDNHFTLENGVYKNAVTDTRSTIQLAVQLWKTTGTYIKTLYVDYLTTTGRHSLTFTVDDPNGHYICLKHNGKTKDFILLFPWTFGLHQFTISLDVLANDPTTIGGIQLTNIQLEPGDTAHTYEPYSSDNTFYGGYIDPVVGEIVMTHEMVSDKWKNWTFRIQASGNDVKRYKFKNFVKYTNGGQGLCISNVAKKKWEDTEDGTPHFYFSHVTSQTPNHDRIEMFLPIGFDEETVVQVIGELIDPIHIPIATQDLKAFFDHNNFWSDTNDDTEVEYAFADRLSERKLIMDTPHIESTSGAIASFSTDMKAPVKELKAYFTPVQEGSGDPSPVNVRPIVGLTCCNLFKANENLLDYTGLDVIVTSYINYTFSDDALTISVKNASSPYNVSYQIQSKWNVPVALRGKNVRFITNGIVNSNANHHGVIIAEFRRSDGTLISDPTMCNNTTPSYSRSYTIPADTAYCVFIFRMNQGTTVTYAIGDYITFNGFGINYDSSDGQYHKYDGETIPIEFPAMKNLVALNYSPYSAQESPHVTIVKQTIDELEFTTHGNYTYEYVRLFYMIPAGTYTAKIYATTVDENDNYSPLLALYAIGERTPFVGIRNGQTVTFTLAENTVVDMRFFGNLDDSSQRTVRFSKFQIERGSVATDYESRATIYGGYVDLIRNKVVATHGIYRTVFGPSNPAGVLGDYERHGYNMNIEFKPAIDLHDNGQGPYNGKTFCNVAFWQWNYFGDSLHYYVDGHQAYIMLPVGTDPDTEIEFCAELAVPIEYDLTPQQLKTLKGLNNIWSDASGNVDVKYWTH